MEQHNRVYDSRTVANYHLDRAARRKTDLGAMHLIKLVYLSHGWTLGLLHRPLIVEDIEARQVGPMIGRLQDESSDAGEAVREPFDAPAAPAFSRDEIHILNQVHDVYGKMSSMQLSSLTHTGGTPWDITWRRHGDGAVIPKDLIETHFAGLAGTPEAKVTARAAK